MIWWFSSSSRYTATPISKLRTVGRTWCEVLVVPYAHVQTDEYPPVRGHEWTPTGECWFYERRPSCGALISALISVVSSQVLHWRVVRCMLYSQNIKYLVQKCVILDTAAVFLDADKTTPSVFVEFRLKLEALWFCACVILYIAVF